jgi:putative flippase GtrA
VQLSPSGLLAHAKSDSGKKQLRYALVSVVFVPLGQVFVQLFYWLLKWPEPVCVLVTAVLLTVPNYYANKLYVWRYSDRERIKTQILVFWVAAMLGTAFAMGFVWIAGRITRNSPEIVHALGLFCAQLLGYGIVWVGRYVFLDKWLFKMTHQDAEPTPEELAELHSEFPV